MDDDSSSSELPEGSVFLPINCVLLRPSPRYIVRPLLALVDASRFKELDSFKWLTASHHNEVSSGHVFRRATAPHFVDRGGKKFWMREGLAARILGIQHTADPRVAYRNGDRLDCRLANLVALSDCTAHNVDPSLMVPPGSSFAHTAAYQEALVERNKRSAELVARFPAGRRPTIPNAEVGRLLSEILDFDDASLKGHDFEWFHSAFVDSGYNLSPQSLKAILTGHRQKIEGIDYERLKRFLPFESRKEQRMRRLELARENLLRGK